MRHRLILACLLLLLQLAGALSARADETDVIADIDAFLGKGCVPRKASVGNLRWQAESVRPRSWVSAVSWSPDCTKLATVDVMGVVRIFRAADRRLEGIIYCDEENPTSLAFSPDGQWLAAASHSALWVWDVAGRLITKSAVAFGTKAKLAWSPDSRRIAVPVYYRQIRILDRDGSHRLTFQAHDNAVTAFAWSPGGTRFISGSRDGDLRLWNFSGADFSGNDENGQNVNRQPPFIELKQQSCVTHVTWHPNASMIATGDTAGVVRLHRLNGQPPDTIQAHGSVVGMQWSHDGRALACGTRSAVFRDIRVTDERPIEVSNNQHVRFAPDGQQFAVVHSNRVSIGRFSGDLTHLAGETHLNVETRPIAWNQDGTALAGGGRDPWLRIWAADGAALPGGWKTDGTLIRGLCWSNKGWLAVAALTDRKIRLLQPDGTELTSFPSPGNHELSVSPDGDKLAIIGLGGQIQIVAPDGRVLTSYSDPELKHPVFGWSPDSSGIAVTSATGRRLMFAGIDGEQPHRIAAGIGEIQALDWHRDGKSIVTVDRDGSVRQWNVDGSKNRLHFQHDKQGGAVAFSPDGQWLATSSADVSIRDSRYTERLRIPRNPRTIIHRLRWSPDSEWLASQGKDRIRLDKPNGKRGPVLRAFGLVPQSMLWSPDGTRIACPTDNESVIVWDADSGRTSWAGLELANGKSAVLRPDGSLIIDNTADFDREYVFVVQNRDGSTTVMNAAEFNAARR